MAVNHEQAARASSSWEAGEGSLGAGMALSGNGDT